MKKHILGKKKRQATFKKNNKASVNKSKPKPKASSKPNKKPNRRTRAAFGSSAWFSIWLSQHSKTFRQSLARLWLSPFATWITLLAIAIALSLPIGLYLLLDNLKSLTDDKREVPTLSLFMKKNVSESLLRDRAQVIQELPSVRKVHVISQEDALKEFRTITGFAETIETLDENPLPHVLVVVPRLESMDNVGLKQLERQLRSFPEVDILQMDVEWVQRLHAIMNIADRVVLVVALLLALTVLLVVGNTVRLEIQNHRDEIEVIKLIGGSNQFIRRPFLYGGVWYGLFGGVLSLLIVQIAMMSLIQPVNELASLYGGDYAVHGLDILVTLKALLSSTLLGLAGAWLAVGRHLRHIEPNN